MYTPESPEPTVEVAKQTTSFWSWIQKIILVIAIGLVVWRGWIFLSDSQRFPIREVKIEATYQHINQQALQELITSQVSGSFFNFSVAKIKNEVLKLAWVESVNVSRSWPDKIIISVTERTPVARWNDNELLSSEAKIFAPAVETIPQDLPVFHGPENQAGEALENYKQINALLEPLKLSIAQVNLDNSKNWQIILNNGIKLTLGNTSVMERAKLFATSYPNVIGNFGADVESVDLRYESGMAVKWKTPAKKPVLDPKNP